MSKDKKTKKPNTEPTKMEPNAIGTVSPIIEKDYVEISLPPNPSKDDIEKAIGEIVAKTKFRSVPGTNNLRATVHACILDIDNDYQRHDPNDPRSVKARLNGKNFDNDKCIEIVCSWRNGRLQIIDGASRFLAGREAGQDYFSVLIVNGFNGLTQKEEAKYYIKQDENKVNMSFHNIHKAALNAEELVHTLFRKYYTLYNLEISRPSRKQKGRYLSSPNVIVAYMYDMYKKHGEESMRQFVNWFFTVYEKSGWLDADTDIVTMAFQANFTKPIGELFINEYPNDDSDVTLAIDGPIMENLVENLRKLTPSDVYIYAREYQDAVRNSGPKRKAPEIRGAIRYAISGMATGKITWNEVIHLVFKDIY